MLEYNVHYIIGKGIVASNNTKEVKQLGKEIKKLLKYGQFVYIEKQKMEHK